MQLATARTVDEHINVLVSRGDFGNHDVYETKLNTSDPYRIVPWVIDLLYIRFGGDGQPITQHYRQIDGGPIPYDTMPDRIESLALLVRSDPGQLQLVSSSFHDIKLEYISYIVIFMDSPYWKVFQRLNNPSRSGVVFNPTKGGAPNHSFFDGKDFLRTLPPGGSLGIRTAVYFINHMKKSDFGDTLGAYDNNGNRIEQKEPFAFDVFFDVSNIPGGEATAFVIDPDGNNLGPPLPPP